MNNIPIGTKIKFLDGDSGTVKSYRLSDGYIELEWLSIRCGGINSSFQDPNNIPESYKFTVVKHKPIVVIR